VRRVTSLLLCGTVVFVINFYERIENPEPEQCEVRNGVFVLSFLVNVGT
jgi:hypothetical protein